jgi:hypothetical protein
LGEQRARTSSTESGKGIAAVIAGRAGHRFGAGHALLDHPLGHVAGRAGWVVTGRPKGHSPRVEFYGRTLEEGLA